MSIAKPFLIANLRVGVERDMEPWLLPNDAFPTLEDCYMFRGRVQRRRGFTSLGRLVTEVIAENKGNANGATFSATLAHTDISPGSVSITVGVITFSDTGATFGSQTGVLIGAPPTNTGTINYVTGAFTLNFSPALGAPVAVTVTYNFYDHLPVMGLRTRELPAINEEQLIGFDTTKANVFSNSTSSFQDITFHKTTSNVFSWTGSNSDFFYTNNYLNAFWATNGTKGFQNVVDTTNPASGDGIRWYDGTGWINFLPQVDTANFLMGSLLIIPFRNRLVMLNTIEGTGFGASTQFRQRARWCQNGTPYYVAPVPAGFTGGTDTNAWRSDIVGKGGFIDAPTQEEIISAEFYKDTLLVFFERSTWQLRYTGNETLPFVWERINVELGAESSFSIVPFDAGIIGVGNYGIISCDATGVKRIDQVIPDEVFNIHNGNDGVKRVYGIRDYSQQLVYWTFPDESNNPTFPTRVLVYNYLDGSYSIFNDSFTCFGTFQPFNDITWADLTIPWQQYPYQWNAGQFQSDFPQICAGNQQGFVFKQINAGSVINAPSLFITNATQAVSCTLTSANHNLAVGTIIKIIDVNGMTQLNGNIYRVGSVTTNTFTIQTLSGTSWINVDSTAFTAYTSGGLITVRNNFKVLTKRFNPFLQSGSQLRIQNVDFFMEGAQTLSFTMDILLDENDNTIIEAPVVMPTSPTLSKVWFRTYVSAIGQFVQLQLTFSDDEIIDPTQSDGDFVLHAMMLWMSESGRLTYGTIV